MPKKSKKPGFCPRCLDNELTTTQGMCQECRKWDRLGKIYNLSRDSYIALLEDQGGRCAICGTLSADMGYNLCVDHDHTCCPGRNSCGECIRGLLCHGCNLMVGQAKDDVKILKSAVRYLEM